MKIEWGSFRLELGWEEFLAGLALLLAPSPLKGILKKRGEIQMSEGIKETQEVVRAVVEIAKALKAAKESNGGIGFDDIALLLPLMQPVSEAIKDVNKIGVEMKDLDSAEVASLAAEAMGGFSEDGKIKIYVEEGFKILASAIKIIKA